MGGPTAARYCTCAARCAMSVQRLDIYREVPCAQPRNPSERSCVPAFCSCEIGLRLPPGCSSCALGVDRQTGARSRLKALTSVWFDGPRRASRTSWAARRCPPKGLAHVCDVMALAGPLGVLERRGDDSRSGSIDGRKKREAPNKTKKHIMFAKASARNAESNAVHFAPTRNRRNGTLSQEHKIFLTRSPFCN